MRLYFEGPSGDRLALDTERREWAATYESDKTVINGDHFIIQVASAEILHGLEREADFNGYSYNDNIENSHAANTSLFTEYLQVLESYSAAAESDLLAEDLAEDFESVVNRIEKARAAGYFTARQYAALLLIIDDIHESIDLYNKAESAYNDAIATQNAKSAAPF